jgi:predicted nucleic acid-binding protein
LPADADLQIAATAVYHGLELVTGNVKHFSRLACLRVASVLADAKAGGQHRHGSPAG